MRGSWELALGKAEGLRRFGQTFEAFWRSFQVILYVLPVYFLQTMLFSLSESSVAEDVATGASNPLFLVGRALLIVIEWLTFPIVMIFLTRLLGVTTRYALFITVSNWSTLMIVGLLLPINLLWNFTGASDNASFFFSLAVMALVMRYRWFIAINVLEVPSLTAIGLVVIEVLISLIFAAITYKVFGFAV